VLESSSIVRQFPEVEPEHLFVEIPKQVKGFDAYIGSFQPALEQAPEILNPLV